MKIVFSWLVSTLLGACVGTGLTFSALEGSVSTFVLAVAMICALILAILWMIIDDDE